MGAGTVADVSLFVDTRFPDLWTGVKGKTDVLLDHRAQEKGKFHVSISSRTTVRACVWTNSGLCVGWPAWLEMDSRFLGYV